METKKKAEAEQKQSLKRKQLESHLVDLKAKKIRLDSEAGSLETEANSLAVKAQDTRNWLNMAKSNALRDEAMKTKQEAATVEQEIVEEKKRIEDILSQ